MKKILKALANIPRVNERIVSGNTGSHTQLAKYIGVTPKTLHYYLDEMRKMLADEGVTITYNAKLKTYEYNKPGSLEIVMDWIPEK
jgi:hypothetical protein